MLMVEADRTEVLSLCYHDWALGIEAVSCNDVTPESFGFGCEQIAGSCDDTLRDTLNCMEQAWSVVDGCDPEAPSASEAFKMLPACQRVCNFGGLRGH